jgi:transposase
MEQRYQAVLEVQAGVPIVDVAQRFGVSRQRCTAGLGAIGPAACSPLSDQSKRPKSSPYR